MIVICEEGSKLSNMYILEEQLVCPKAVIICGSFRSLITISWGKNLIVLQLLKWVIWEMERKFAENIRRIHY